MGAMAHVPYDTVDHEFELLSTFVAPIYVIDGFAGRGYSLFATSAADRLEAQRIAALEAIHGPMHGPGRREYHRAVLAAYRRSDLRERVAELVPGLHHGTFIRAR